MTKTFRLTQSTRPTRDGNLGATRTVCIDTITELDGGVQVSTHCTGHIEGTRIDQRSSTFYGAVTLAKASAYRIRLGYTEVAS